MILAEMSLNERSPMRALSSECSDEVHLIPLTIHLPSSPFTVYAVARILGLGQAGPDDARVLLGFFTEQNLVRPQCHLPLTT